MTISSDVWQGRKNYDILIAVKLTLVSLLFFSFLIHFILRQISNAHQIIALRDIMMIGTATLLFVVLHAFPITSSRNGSATNLPTDVLARFASVFLAASLAVCSATAFSSQIALPLFPSVNLGWLLGFASAAFVALALRSPAPSTNVPILSIGVLMLGFIAAEGIRQGLITVGTIAWNVVTDFDLAILVPIVSLLHLIEFIVLVKKNDDIERSEELTGMVRKILAAVTIFALAMGISLESVVIVCGSAVLVMSLIYVLIPLSPREQVEPSSRWNRFCRRGIAWCALACTIAIVLRGFAHLGESAAIATVALALAGISLRWMKPRDLVTILLNVTSSMLVLGLAFIIAALWNLFANHHAELESLVRLLGIPQVAIFPVAILLLFGLTYWLNPLISVVVATPVLYLGLEQPALAPVWTAPVIAILLSTAMCLRYRLRSVRVVGVAGSGLLVVVNLGRFRLGKVGWA